MVKMPQIRSSRRARLESSIMDNTSCHLKLKSINLLLKAALICATITQSFNAGRASTLAPYELARTSTLDRLHASPSNDLAVINTKLEHARSGDSSSSRFEDRLGQLRATFQGQRLLQDLRDRFERARNVRSLPYNTLNIDSLIAQQHNRVNHYSKRVRRAAILKPSSEDADLRGSSLTVAHEPPAAQEATSANEHSALAGSNKSPADNMGTDSIWPTPTGEPFATFEAPGAPIFGLRSNSKSKQPQPGAESGQRASYLRGIDGPTSPMNVGDADRLNRLVQEHPKEHNVEAVQFQSNRQDLTSAGQENAPRHDQNADQINLASSDEHSSDDKYENKPMEPTNDEFPDNEDEQLGLIESKKLKYHKKEEISFELPPPPPKKVIVKKEEKHHHYHHHLHHHRPEKKVDKEQSPATPPLHLEIHIKGKEKSNKKSKGVNKEQSKEKSKTKEDDEIYVKLNHGGNGEGANYGQDEGNYNHDTSGDGLIEDKKSLIEDGQDKAPVGVDDGSSMNSERQPAIDRKSAASKQASVDSESVDEGDKEASQDVENRGEDKSAEKKRPGGEDEKSDSESDKTGVSSNEKDPSDTLNTSQVPNHSEEVTEDQQTKEEGQSQGGEEGGVSDSEGQKAAEDEQSSGGGEQRGAKEESNEVQMEPRKHQEERSVEHKKPVGHKKPVENKKPVEHKKPVVHKEPVEQRKPVDHKKKMKKEEKKVEMVDEKEERTKEEAKEEVKNEVKEEVQDQPKVKEEEPKVEEKQQEKKHGKVHKQKHAHIELHQHKHFEHHEHINLNQPEKGEEPFQAHGELGGHELDMHNHKGELEEAPLAEHHDVMHHRPHMQMDAPMMQHHHPIEPEHHHPVEPEHHHPIKEQWIVPDLHEKPPNEHHLHGAFVIEDHSLLDKHDYENPHGRGVHFKEEHITHPHGFGLTPVAAYNLMGAYSSQSAAHSTREDENRRPSGGSLKTERVTEQKVQAVNGAKKLSGS